MRVFIFSTVFLLAILSGYCGSLTAAVVDPYSISAFRITNRSFPFRGNDIIRSVSGRACQEIDSIASVKPGMLLLRKKYEPGDYRIYKGKIDTAAFSRSPPLYSFLIPSGISVFQFAKKRLFSIKTSDQSSDVDEVYFDTYNFFVRHFSILYYYHNDKLCSIEGKREYPTCSIEISSEPSGAQVVVNGISTVRMTPCKLDRMPCGNYIIELFLPHYHFSQQNINVRADTTVRLSYALMSDFDTMYISGTVPYGILYFPKPPLDTFFTVDTMKVADSKASLFAGSYRVKWNGGLMYESIDTVLTVKEGRADWFDQSFVRRRGMLLVKTLPYDAEVCIESKPCSYGDRAVELESGSYSVSVSQRGFQTIRKTVNVLPDTVNEFVIDLRMNADRDADGFLDSVDKCPDEYGIYDGCPKQGFLRVLKVKKDEVAEYVKNDRFDIGVSLIGYIARIPSNRQFSSFLSSFAAGRAGGINNYRGLTMLNTYHIMYRGLYCSAELGQWSSGIRYKRSDTIDLISGRNHYTVFYDSSEGIEPTIYLPSTSFSFGAHYNWSWVNVIYAIGHQWEDIVIEQVYNVNENRLEKVVYNNDWWFHHIHIEGDLHADSHFVPSVYFNMKFPFGNAMRTRWHSMQVGLQMKLYPFNVKEKNE